MKIRYIVFFSIEYFAQYLIFDLLAVLFMALSHLPLLSFVLGLGSARGTVEVVFASGFLTYVIITSINSKAGDEAAQRKILLYQGVVCVVRNIAYFIADLVTGENFVVNIIFIAIGIAYISKSKSKSGAH